MRSYLLTGGAGFIGTNLADHHLSRGDRVVVLDNFSREGTEGNVAWLRERHGDRLEVVRADVRDPPEDLLPFVEEVDVVFHLAAQVAVTTSVEDPREDFEVNALGTFNVLEAVRASTARPTVVYSSTNKVYGGLPDVAVDESGSRYEFRNRKEGISETRPLDFHSPYGCSKGAGDQYAVDYARIYGLPTVVFRQSCIYGPHQHGVEDQGWVAWFAIRAMTGLPVTIFGDGKQIRDVLHIDDLIAAFDAAVDRIDVTSGEAYNIGGGPANTLSLLELIELLDREYGWTLPYEFADPRPGDQLVYVSDIRKARRDFGWEPGIGVETGVDSLVSWLGANRGRFARDDVGARPA